MAMTTVVTGSASGIGAATRKHLEATGYSVTGVDLKKAEISGDLSVREGRERVIAQILERCNGKLDALVLCAGLGPHVPNPALIAYVNYFGAVDLLDGLFPALQKGTKPAAVVISSVSSTQITWDANPLAAAFEAGDEARIDKILKGAGEQAGFLAYAASKNALTVALRKRTAAWGKAGVRLNAVAPGAVQTPLLEDGMKDPRYGASIRNFVPPVGRRADPREIAAGVAFLLGDNASYVHGAQLVIDGGIDAVSRPTQF